MARRTGRWAGVGQLDAIGMVKGERVMRMGARTRCQLVDGANESVDGTPSPPPPGLVRHHPALDEPRQRHHHLLETAAAVEPHARLPVVDRHAPCERQRHGAPGRLTTR